MKAQIERDLIVARSGGMQACCDVAHPFAELTLDGHVNVFFVVGETQRSCAGFVVERTQCVSQDPSIGLSDDARAGQHRDVRGAADQVFSQQCTVVTQRRGPR